MNIFTGKTFKLNFKYFKFLSQNCLKTTVTFGLLATLVTTTVTEVTSEAAVAAAAAVSAAAAAAAAAAAVTLAAMSCFC